MLAVSQEYTNKLCSDDVFTVTLHPVSRNSPKLDPFCSENFWLAANGKKGLLNHQ
jgi:hypothetical protein